MNQEGSTGKLRSFFKESLIIGCIVILLLVGLELAFRLFLPGWHDVKKGHFRKDYQLDPLLTRGVFLLDEHAFWRLAPDEYSGISMSGFREGAETAENPPEGTFRIICVGDSVTFGVPVTLNTVENTFAKQLERLIDDRLGKDKVQVMNAGTPGYTSFQGLRQLKHHLLTYKPDLLIIQYGLNDSSPAVGQTDKEQMTRSEATLSLYNLLSKSALCCAVVTFLRQHRGNVEMANDGLQRVPPVDFKKNALVFKALGRLHGFECLFIRPVRFENGVLSTIESHQPPANSKIVDMLSAFRKYSGSTADLFHDNCHLTPEGHALLAAAIFDAFQKYDLLNSQKEGQMPGSEAARFTAERDKGEAPPLSIQEP